MLLCKTFLLFTGGYFRPDHFSWLFFTINQGFIGVITMFGKYRRIVRPGLRFKFPLIENVFKKISYQNRSVELEFQAITADQANVYFKSMLLYSVQNQDEETLRKWHSNL